jgi:o-succinylbenzoate synthase
MKFYWSRYHENGALLKLIDGPSFCGHSDIRAYPEYGDATLDEHLENLLKGKLSQLVKRALAFAHTDALGRRSQRNLFAGLSLPRCHKQIRTVKEAQAGSADGFKVFKIKMGRSLESETALLLEVAKLGLLRLDFNGLLSHSEFHLWWNILPAEVKAKIDFVEDAFHDISKSSDKKISAPLAWDWLPAKNCNIKIVKPTRDNLELVRTDRRVIFTHSFGHLLGQATSLWTAARFYKRFPNCLEICGLMPSEETPLWPHQGPQLMPPKGLGFGLDEMLSTVKWEVLS